MDKDQDKPLEGREYSLEEILEEFSSRPRGERISAPEDDLLYLPDFLDKPRPKAPPQKKRAPAPPEEKKVISFPGTPEQEKEPEPPLSRLLKKADNYAAHMFEEEEPDPEALRAQRYLPGVDEERAAPRPVKRFKPRRVKPAAPDLSAQELAGLYGKGLSGLRWRYTLVFLLALPLLYLVLTEGLPLPLPGPLAEPPLQRLICIVLQLLALLLSLDLVKHGLTHLGTDTLTVLAAAAALADACTITVLEGRGDSPPFCLVSVLALGISLRGRWLKRDGLRTACRTAAAARTPYLVTLDEDAWDSRAAFSKWSGASEGFGSRIQGDDPAERIFRPLTPVLLLACLLLSVLATVNRDRPELMLWALSASLCAAATFSGALAFSLPFRPLSRRLAGQGAALAGWEGLSGAAVKGAGILLTDSDLFPPGSVTLNGLKVFNNFPLDKVISVTATIIRDIDSALDRPFHEFLRAQGAVYRKTADLCCYEGGASAMIRGDQVLVGTSAFLHLMEVDLPPGLNVKNAVFCAINGELAGIFALNYTLHVTVRPAISALISNKVPPILATRDFNLIPSMLLQRFKLPVEKMEFPEQARRRTLSDPCRIHSRTLVCVLCREGLGPYADAVVGAKRLRLAARLSAFLSAAGCVVGVLLTYYLASQAAFSALSVLNLLIFLLLWLVPTLLISGWVGKY